MALRVLSPWPSSPAALDAATKVLRDATGIKDDDTAQRLGKVASLQVERYAPDAPQELRNEAVIRLAGHAQQSATVPANLRSVEAGSLKLDFATAAASRSFTLSGARALLSPWRTRRALPVESAS